MVESHAHVPPRSWRAEVPIGDDVSTNLTALALDDYDAVLTESLTWGAARSIRTHAVLLRHFADIANGTAAGRLRDDIPFRVETRSIRVGRTLYLIFYRPGERLVVRIVHGRRDLPALLADDLP